MNEIKKLYENAGLENMWVERYHDGYCRHENYYKSYEDMISTMSREYNLNEIETKKLAKTYCKKELPPFTAEKQLELIKWLGELDMLEIVRTTREDKAWIINSEYGMSGNVYKHTSRMKSFEEALAKLINSLWQDLTEEEKQQIKEILE